MSKKKKSRFKNFLITIVLIGLGFMGAQARTIDQISPPPRNSFNRHVKMYSYDYEYVLNQLKKASQAQTKEIVVGNKSYRLPNPQISQTNSLSFRISNNGKLGLLSLAVRPQPPLFNRVDKVDIDTWSPVTFPYKIYRTRNLAHSKLELLQDSLAELIAKEINSSEKDVYAILRNLNLPTSSENLDMFRAVKKKLFYKPAPPLRAIDSKRGGSAKLKYALAWKRLEAGDHTPLDIRWIFSISVPKKFRVVTVKLLKEKTRLTVSLKHGFSEEIHLTVELGQGNTQTPIEIGSPFFRYKLEETDIAIYRKVVQAVSLGLHIINLELNTNYTISKIQFHYTVKMGCYAFNGHLLEGPNNNNSQVYVDLTKLLIRQHYLNS